jgi:hypothetical protein
VVRSHRKIDLRQRLVLVPEHVHQPVGGLSCIRKFRFVSIGRQWSDIDKPDWSEQHGHGKRRAGGRVLHPGPEQPSAEFCAGFQLHAGRFQPFQRATGLFSRVPAYGGSQDQRPWPDRGIVCRFRWRGACFLLNNGHYSTIDFPGAVATEALAINNWTFPGIAGNYTDSSGKVHGFVFIGGRYIPVNASFAVNLSVNGMNDLGQLAGTYDLGGPLGTAPTSGFTGTLGSLEPLNYPQIFNYPTSTLPNALNNKNEIAGEFTETTQYQLRIDAFLEGGGNFQPISHRVRCLPVDRWHRDQ